MQNFIFYYGDNFLLLFRTHPATQDRSASFANFKHFFAKERFDHYVQKGISMNNQCIIVIVALK